ncbi:MAG TPA: glycosyltransferase family 39 protein [Candidatus Binatia bacterium]|nr:glycosyltransferase family 39 protein [Candidatus Binatia bacterium]
MSSAPTEVAPTAGAPHAGTGFTPSPTRRVSPLAGWVPVLVLAAVAAVAFAVRLDASGFYFSEAHLAEVSREMYLSGDYVTPQLDGILFLNKPPLLFWLTAMTFHLTGPNEWGRLVSVVAAALTLIATARLAARLYSASAGLLAGAVLASTVGFALEARTLRPDILVVLSVTVAILCWHHAHTDEERATPWLVACYAALGAGMMAKGFVPLVVALVPIGVVCLRNDGWRGLLRLRPGLGTLVLAAVLLPWHLAVALQHPGFAWDYLVNQHFLFFLDRKLPRDSEGIALASFWGAFLGRALPWILLVPLTLREAAAGIRRDAGRAAEGSLLLWSWMLGVLLVFSCAPSRLEHYSLPALPAAALLATRGLQRLSDGDASAWVWRWVSVVALVVLGAGVVCLGTGQFFLRRTEPIAEIPELSGVVTPVSLAFLAGGVLLLLAVRRRSARGSLAAMMLVAVPLAVIAVRAEVAVEPLLSWRPLVRAVLDRTPPSTEIVLEAPEEYQVVGGLAFYAGRRITLLEVPGLVPPTYLSGQRRAMFLPRDEFQRRWRAGERLVLVSNPQLVRDAPPDIVAAPARVVFQSHGQWALTNVLAGEP